MLAKRVIIEIPNLQSYNKADPYRVNELTSSDEEDSKIAAPANSQPKPLSLSLAETEVINKPSEAIYDPILPFLPTLEATPMLAPLSKRESSPDNSYISPRNKEGKEPAPALIKEIIEDLNTRNIIQSPRKRRPTSHHHEAYIMDLQSVDKASGFYSAFSTRVFNTKDNTGALLSYYDEVPLELKN
jgi:hypothetical protein